LEEINVKAALEEIADQTTEAAAADLIERNAAKAVLEEINVKAALEEIADQTTEAAVAALEEIADQTTEAAAVGLIEKIAAKAALEEINAKVVLEEIANLTVLIEVKDEKNLNPLEKKNLERSNVLREREQSQRRHVQDLDTREVIEILRKQDLTFKKAASF
jgi:hypothetical protein